MSNDHLGVRGWSLGANKREKEKQKFQFQDFQVSVAGAAFLPTQQWCRLDCEGKFCRFVNTNKSVSVAASRSFSPPSILSTCLVSIPRCLARAEKCCVLTHPLGWWIMQPSTKAMMKVKRFLLTRRIWYSSRHDSEAFVSHNVIIGKSSRAPLIESRSRSRKPLNAPKREAFHYHKFPYKLLCKYHKRQPSPRMCA